MKQFSIVKHKIKLLGFLSLLFIAAYGMNSCVTLPEGITPVTNFKQEEYLGKWYEIARLDHSFERGLSNVSAEYSIREGGGIKVLNRGYNREKKEWKEAEGKAFFVKESDIGHLKVSFFGPFYGSYVVFNLDEEDYKHAYITSYNRDFLWFLSRSPNVTETEKNRFLKKVEKLGFDVDGLIFVDHGEKMD